MYLNCKTWFSLKYGTFKTEELVIAAVERGAQTLALTNINCTCDIWDFVDFCQQNNIKPIAGCEIRNEDAFCYILLARNAEGLFSINRFLSIHLQLKKDFPPKPEGLNDVFIIYPLSSVLPQDLQEHEFIGVQTTEVNKLFAIKTASFPGKFLVRQPVTFQDKTAYEIHRLLRAIDKNIVLSKQTPAQIAAKHESFVSQTELVNAFGNTPDLVINTLHLMERCSIEMEFHIDKTKKVYSAAKGDDKTLLEKLAHDGMKRRFGKGSTAEKAKAKARVVKELKIINDLGFNAYFLVTWDIIRYARSRDFFYVGRGSGGNSIVAYCLDITEVDPLELDLYFERFLNPYRSVPPDFDIDFSHLDRDEMIDYIFKRYGSEHVCLLGAYTTFQNDSIFRELGKVFGLPKSEIDDMQRYPIANDKVKKWIFKYAPLLKNFPNHLSIHAGGILVSDKPMQSYTATELPPKGFTTSQIDMFVAEKIGLFKLDVLSQRGLGHIKECVELVQANRGITIDITRFDLFKKDSRVADQIRKADTIGCFYIESPAMRQLLKKLHCDDYLTLVAASSIIRPGVSQSGMMKQYIYRFHNPKDFTYLHPKMEELLRETYGVMVYQEDVIKVAHHFAGLDMGEADVLRRAMSGKYRSHKQFEQIRAKFFSNCKSFGYEDNLANEVWRQIESFGGYSFSKAHSASFAVESYQSLYLKTYYPIEFMTAVLNNFGGFYNHELYFHELKRAGAMVQLPCINTSEAYCFINGIEVTIGFVFIQGVESVFTQAILDNRVAYGAFEHLQSFIERLSPKIEQLNILIRIGAFRFTGKSKKELLWEANFLQKKNSKHEMGNLLFHEKPIDFKLPQLEHHPLDDALDEIELLGFALCQPFSFVDGDPNKYVPARDLANHLGKEIDLLGYLITSKTVHTVKHENMYFHTFIDAEGDWLDTVFFPSAAARFRIMDGGFYAMTGKVIEEFGVHTVDVHSCRKVGLKQRNARANVLDNKDRTTKQILVERPGT